MLCLPPLCVCVQDVHVKPLNPDPAEYGSRSGDSGTALLYLAVCKTQTMAAIVHFTD